MSCPACENRNGAAASAFTEEEKKNGIYIALAGNPNSGKTTAFNKYTGSHQHVGNYPGVTVEKKEGWLSIDDCKIAMVDLPGTYSLTAYSIEERVTREVLAPEDSSKRPRAVIDIIDSAALERGIFLALQMRELGMPVVLACNMMDEARNAGVEINVKRLSERLNSPVVPTVARSGEGLQEALHAALEAATNQGQEELIISYGPDLDPALLDMVKIIKEKEILTNRYPARWTAIKLLENDEVIRGQVEAADKDAAHELSAIRDTLASHLAGTFNTTPDAIITDYRHGYIHGLLKDGVIRKDDTKDRMAFTDKLDKVFTNTILGPIIMLAVVYFMFWATFTLGESPQGWVEDFFGWLAEVVGEVLPEGLLQSLICDGVIEGVGGVLSFVPLILIMFLIVSFLEDCGYMARMAYMLDRIMRAFGLHGASVMPYIIAGGIAGGCAIPGLMATRTMRSPKERMATMLTLPFMSCGAKVPVFLMLTAAFFSENQASIMFAVTLAGWAAALLVSRFLRSSILKGKSTPFVMELPPYRMPTLRSILTHTWERGWMYIKKAGTIILAISIVLWAALTFPGLDEETSDPFESKIATFEDQIAPLEEKIAELQQQLESGDADKDALTAQIEESISLKESLEDEKTDVENELASLELRNTIGGRLGTAIEPVFKPLGFDWRTDVALLSGVAAKEAVLSTMGTAYAIGETDPDEPESLSEKLASDEGWSKTVALSLMLFVLIYSPCFITLCVFKNEVGTWKWVIFSMVFNTAVAYGVAYIGRIVGLALWG